MGVHLRDRRARGHRPDVRREQRLRLRLQPRLRSLRVRAQRPARAHRADPPRRPHQSRQVHHRHPQRPRDRSGLGPLPRDDRALWTGLDADRVGRRDSGVCRGLGRGRAGAEACAIRRSRRAHAPVRAPQPRTARSGRQHRARGSSSAAQPSHACGRRAARAKPRPATTSRHLVRRERARRASELDGEAPGAPPRAREGPGRDRLRLRSTSPATIGSCRSTSSRSIASSSGCATAPRWSRTFRASAASSGRTTGSVWSRSTSKPPRR